MIVIGIWLFWGGLLSVKEERENQEMKARIKKLEKS